MKIAIMLAALMIIKGSLAADDDLSRLKTQTVRYRAAIETVLALSANVTCSETIAKADQYTSAKLDYYQAARAVIPILLSKANTNRDERDVIETVRARGGDVGEEATITLESRINRCPDSIERKRVWRAIEYARQVEEQFLKDFVPSGSS
jgi:hypothetical protein